MFMKLFVKRLIVRLLKINLFNDYNDGQNIIGETSASIRKRVGVVLNYTPTTNK